MSSLSEAQLYQYIRALLNAQTRGFGGREIGGGIFGVWQRQRHLRERKRMQCFHVSRWNYGNSMEPMEGWLMLGVQEVPSENRGSPTK